MKGCIHYLNILLTILIKKMYHISNLYTRDLENQVVNLYIIQWKVVKIRMGVGVG